MKKLIVGCISVFNAIVLYGFCSLSTSIVVAAEGSFRSSHFKQTLMNFFYVPFLLVLLLGLSGVILIISGVRESKG